MNRFCQIADIGLLDFSSIKLMNRFGRIPDIGLLDHEKLYSLSIYFVEIIKFLIQIAIAFNPGNIYDTCIFQSDSDMIKLTAFLLCVVSKSCVQKELLNKSYALCNTICNFWLPNKHITISSTFIISCLIGLYCWVLCINLQYLYHSRFETVLLFLMLWEKHVHKVRLGILVSHSSSMSCPILM